MIGQFGRGLTCSVLLVSFSACATTATIHRVDSADNEAEIVSSDAEALIIRGSNGRLYRLDRDRVSDVDHPGNVDMVVGGILLGVVGLILASLPSNEQRFTVLPAVIIYGVPGAALFGYGTYQYVKSVRAAALPEGVMAPLPLPLEPRVTRRRDSWSTLPKIGRTPAPESGPPLGAEPAPQPVLKAAPDTGSSPPADGALSPDPASSESSESSGSPESPAPPAPP
jgi:hypothetical protein